VLLHLAAACSAQALSPPALFEQPVKSAFPNSRPQSVCCSDVESPEQ
jgi:hypothetical protein